MLRDLLLRNRSYRRFQQQPLDEQTLVELLELTRLCPSAANRQPLKYLLAWRPDQYAKIFRTSAGRRPSAWPGPAEGERPTGYIVILGDNRIGRPGNGTPASWPRPCCWAAERGLGGCMIGSIDQPGLRPL